jgi:hypothetical protein
VKYTAFTPRKGQATTARLIVRRVKDKTSTAALPDQGCASIYQPAGGEAPLMAITSPELSVRSSKIANKII